jgi:SAM-dependent methyltransferase
MISKKATHSQKNDGMTKMVSLLLKQKFDPGVLGLIINPFYFARRLLRKAVSDYAPQLTGRILDAGCGQKPYRPLFNCVEYIGMDIQQEGHSHKCEQIDVFYDGMTFPFPNESFDGVLCSQVVEHVFNPDVFLGEVCRVLKPDGKLLLTVPFVWDEHEQPYDYARYSMFGLKHLLNKNGFDVIAHQKTGDDFRVLVQMTNLYIYKCTTKFRKTQIGGVISTMILNAPLNLLGALLWRLLPANKDLYLDSVVLSKKRN